MTGKDLNLLRILLLLLERRNVSSVAKSLRLTQPALSRSLARLRDQFEDPLFVRSSVGMLPTPKALALEGPLREVLAAADNLYASSMGFVPGKAQGQVRIATTDYFEQVVWTDLLPHLLRKAPGISFATITTGSVLAAEAMQRGEIQLAIAGFFKNLPAALRRQEIFKDHYLTVSRKDHPEISKILTKKIYFELAHLIVSPGGDLEGSLDSAIRNAGETRRIAASVSSFLASGPVVANSDLVLTAPSLLVRKFFDYLDLNAYAPPVPFGEISVAQVWHERYSLDPMLTWVRSEIAQWCAKVY